MFVQHIRSYLSSTKLKTRSIGGKLMQSLCLKRLLLLLDGRISKNSLRNYRQDFIGSVLLNAFVNDACCGMGFNRVVATDAFATFKLTLKENLATSSLIQPSYQMGATIYKKVFFPQKCSNTSQLQEENFFIDRIVIHSSN